MPDPVAVLVGLVAGAIGVVVLVAPVRRGVGAVEATAVGVGVVGWVTDPTSPQLLAAMAVVLIGARLPADVRWLQLAALAAAAWLVGTEWPFEVAEYHRWLAAAAVVVLAALGRTGARAFGATWTLALMVWVPLAAYLAVPDTEEVTVVGVAFASAGMATVVARHAPRRHELDAVAVAVVWSILLGGRLRWASYAVIAAVGVLVLGPVVAGLGRRVDWGTAPARLLAVVHVACGVVVARYAALGVDRDENLVRAVVVLGVAMIVSIPLVRGAMVEASA